MKKSKKLNIYLGDLVHNSVAKGPFTIPLNIGYIGAYAKKQFNKDINIKLFKYPNQIIDAIKENHPSIIGLSNYAWNVDLNYKIIEFAKGRYNQIISVLGGPEFPVDNQERKDYLKQKPLVDFYIVKEGECNFSSLVGRVLEKGGSVSKIKESAMDGCVFLRGQEKELVVGRDETNLPNLDEIPSPYLSGILYNFFDDWLLPMIETDRGCPYTCTYCAWGNDRKLRLFDIARVKAEIDYIVKHVKNTDCLCIANANFGIYKRDTGIAEHIKRARISVGYPRNLLATWAKNTSKRVVQIADLLGDMVEITMSFQSLDPLVGKNIRRDNIEISSFIELQDYFNREGIPSVSEVILALPGETKESHLNTLRRLFDMGVGDILCYNLRALGGTVLNTPQERAKYNIKTKYRLYDVGFGKYDGIVAIEADEIVRSTSTLSEEDVFSFRPLHWLIQFLWGFKYYIHLLKYLQSTKVHPLDFMMQIIQDKKDAPEIVSYLFNDFERESQGEWFNTREELFDYYSKKDNFDTIMRGEFGKLNYKYMFKVLCECRRDFDVHLGYVAKKMLDREVTTVAEKQTAHNIVDNLIRYMRGICVEFDANLNFPKHKTDRFDYDILSWQQSSYKGSLADYHKVEGVAYRFTMSGEQYKGLSGNIRQFRHADRNVTLRKMSEYIRKVDLFYKVLKNE